MTSDVGSATHFLARLLEDGLGALLMNLIDSAVGALHRRPNVPFLQRVDVRLESIAGKVGVSLQSAANELGVARHFGVNLVEFGERLSARIARGKSF